MREATLKRWINRGYGNEKVKKLIGKIENGFLVLVHVCHSSGLSRPITERKGLLSRAYGTAEDHKDAA